MGDVKRFEIFGDKVIGSAVEAILDQDMISRR